MGNIVLLDDLTINKIAAGEVIERPASVIKEMVENSIDAGATNITVEIKNGGISFIRVSDNGKGIAQDDLEIAFERHATSKIRSADDLDTVTSMGFRGEALASIAAIANVEMVSKTEEQEIGYKVVVEAGNVLEKEEAGCRTGTTITVRNLFFNTPVRYKFLKKDYTESGYIEDAITRIALVNPHIAIKLINTGKTVIQTNGSGDLKSVIYSIYGKDVANGIMELTYQYEDIKVTGAIGKPEIARSNRSNQLFFVNKRYIKDKTLSAATEQAYKGLIPIGKFGFAIINIEMNPAKVDVNVHPAKLEVRFQEENKIFQAIYHAIKETLLKGELVANTEKQSTEVNEEKQIQETIRRDVLSFDERLRLLKESKKENASLGTGLFGFRKQSEKQIEEYTEEESKIKTNILEDIYNNKNKKSQEIQVNEESEKYQLELPKTLQENAKTKSDETVYVKAKEETLEVNAEPIEAEGEQDNKELEPKKEELQEEIRETESSVNNFNEMYAKLFGTMPKTEETQEELKKEEKSNVIDIVKDNVSMFETQEEVKKPVYKIVGIAFKTYIILEMNNEMYILDQHAAHERIMYEKVKKNYYSEKEKDSQMLLLPDIITLTHKEMEIAKDNIKMFEQAGFCLEEFGENTIKLTGVPTICIDLDTKELFLETLDEINTVARTAKQEKEERFIATVACKSAVKANMALTNQEVENLMDSLLQLPNPFTCPHGRPTAIKMTKYDIERKFARK